jgi:predicted transcriptional regulator
MDISMARATVDLEPALHKALQDKAAATHRTISELVNDAVREALREDQEDLAAFEERAKEKTIGYEELLKRLEADGTL